MKKNKRNLKTSSLSGDDGVIDIESTDVTNEVAEKVKAPASETKKIISPLLSEPVKVNDYATGIGPQSGGNATPSNDLDSLKVDNDFFATKPVEVKPVDYTLKKSDLMEEKKPDLNIPTAGTSMPPMKPDVPEQNFNPNPDAAAQDNIPVPDNVARQAASELTDTILSMYKRLVPDLSHEYTKLNVKEIKKLEESGDLMVGAHSDVVKQNLDNKKELEKRAHDDAAMIKKPLAKLLEVKQINAPPHIELLIILIFVALTYFMMVRGIKKSNDDLLAKLYSQIVKDRAGSSAQSVKDPESDIPLVETEKVI